MGRSVCRNDRGFTLIEVLVAMVVLALGFLGAVGAMIGAVDANLQNALRNEGVKLAQERLEVLRNGAYAAIVDDSFSAKRQVRKNTLWDFQVEQEVSNGTYLKVVEISVSWSYKNRNHRHQTMTVVHQPLS